MNVVLRNLVSLASEGAFGCNNAIMPMSDFKWEILYKLSLHEDVAPYVWRGVLNHEDDKFTNIPPKVKSLLGKTPFNNQDELISSFDITDIETQKLSYIVKKYTLKDIVYKERHSIDTSKISLDFLSLILQNTNIILRNGIRMRGIIEIGLFLRNKGQHVDFIKIESWLRKLKLRQMASLQASVLVDMFSFGNDEFPYIRKFVKKGKIMTIKSLERVIKANKLDRTFNKYSIVNFIKFYKYSHSEALCKTVSTLTRGLSEIEE